MELISHSFGIVLYPNSYYFTESQNDESEFETLEKIQSIVKNQLHYDTLHQDSYSEIPQKELFTLLKEKSLQIHQEVLKEEQAILKKKKTMEVYLSNIGCFIVQSKGLPLLDDIVAEMAKYMELPEIFTLARVSVQNNKQVKSYFFDQAKSYGFEGKNKDEGYKFINDLFKAVVDLEGLLPIRVYNKKNKLEPEKTLTKLFKEISTPGIFSIFSTYSIFSFASTNFRQIFTARTFEVTKVVDEYVRGNGSRALFYAIQSKERSIVKLLLKHNADPYHLDSLKKANTLHLACQLGLDDIVELILKIDGDVNVKHSGGSTALAFACGYGNTDYFTPNVKVIELLLKHGANPNIPTKTGLTPLSLARGNKLHDIVTLLMQHDAH